MRKSSGITEYLKSGGKHYIFCMPQTGASSVILAILHERMDLMPRLKIRLR
jgi:plasmid stabilization system protein ParE